MVIYFPGFPKTLLPYTALDFSLKDFEIVLKAADGGGGSVSLTAL
jgi:hypothetical protein